MKELRFIIYSIPMLNLPAALTLARISHLNKSTAPGLLPRLLALIALCLLAVTALASWIFLWVSAHNYPGGTAMVRLHQLVAPEEVAVVHIENSNLEPS